MKRILLWKGLTVIGLALLLLIPLGLIESQIAERSSRKREVEENIAQTAAGRQQIAGPFLVLSYSEEVKTWARDDKGELLKDPKTSQPFMVVEDVSKTHVIVPREMRLDGKVQVEERYRGIYKAPVFHLNASMKGTFEVPADLGLPKDRQHLTLGRVRLVMALSDIRGVQSRPRINLGGCGFDFEAGETYGSLGRGLVLDLGDLTQFKSQVYTFEIPSFQLMGTQALSMAPVAEDTQVTLGSPWANPSFGGRFLPTERQISGKGFEARWQVAGMARDLDSILHAQKGSRAPEAFEVSFVEPVNVYLQSERAVKYGFLFVGLVFAGFFFFELLRRLRIHPMQYLLVGFSLAMFFLLLFSLSEHVPFAMAYGAAAAGSIGLLWAYLSAVLKNGRHGGTFAICLTLLYGVLYGVLASEDNALLMGSLLLFGVLAITMLTTRKVDWYSLGTGSTASAGFTGAEDSGLE